MNCVTGWNGVYASMKGRSSAPAMSQHHSALCSTRLSEPPHDFTMSLQSRWITSISSCRWLANNTTHMESVCKVTRKKQIQCGKERTGVCNASRIPCLFFSFFLLNIATLPLNIDIRSEELSPSTSLDVDVALAYTEQMDVLCFVKRCVTHILLFLLLWKNPEGSAFSN